MVNSLRIATLLLPALLLAGCAGSGPATTAAGQAACGWQLQPNRTIDGGWDGTNFIQFRRPVALAADINGIWFYDAGHRAVLRLEPFTDALATVLSARLSADTQLALDKFGQLYLADPRQGKILRFDETTGQTEVFADGIGFAPSLLALDNQGRVLVADDMAGRILALNSLGGREDIGGIIEGDRFSRIGGLATDGERLWVSDPVQRRVQAFTDGRLVAEISHPGLIQPGPLAVDQQGRVIVADTFNRQLFVFTPDTDARDAKPTTLSLGSLDGLTVGFGEVYVADGVAGRIHVLGVSARACEENSPRSGGG
ncbi:NHL repeat-containing protein [Marinobacter sp.]|uniref:NHL repeat-containing protein n=1 Tax=Marinobacter sp. TaxID=50741 RepID=UPI002B46A659|nr:NHL repeat-containing protein [Marinobacter sp.]HKK55681.1 NHL repeat-containing protein [Marinobacter sp.]